MIRGVLVISVVISVVYGNHGSTSYGNWKDIFQHIAEHASPAATIHYHVHLLDKHTPAHHASHSHLPTTHNSHVQPNAVDKHESFSQNHLLLNPKSFSAHTNPAFLHSSHPELTHFEPELPRDFSSVSRVAPVQQQATSSPSHPLYPHYTTKGGQRGDNVMKSLPQENEHVLQTQKSDHTHPRISPKPVIALKTAQNQLQSNIQAPAPQSEQEGKQNPSSVPINHSALSPIKDILDLHNKISQDHKISKETSRPRLATICNHIREQLHSIQQQFLLPQKEPKQVALASTPKKNKPVISIQVNGVCPYCGSPNCHGECVYNNKHQTKALQNEYQEDAYKWWEHVGVLNHDTNNCDHMCSTNHINFRPQWWEQIYNQQSELFDSPDHIRKASNCFHQHSVPHPNPYLNHDSHTARSTPHNPPCYHPVQHTDHHQWCKAKNVRLHPSTSHPLVNANFTSPSPKVGNGFIPHTMNYHLSTPTHLVALQGKNIHHGGKNTGEQVHSNQCFYPHHSSEVYGVHDEREKTVYPLWERPADGECLQHKRHDNSFRNFLTQENSANHLERNNQFVCPYCGKPGCHGECLQQHSVSPFCAFMNQKNSHHEPSLGHKNQAVCPFCGRVGCHGECLQQYSSVCPFCAFMNQKNSHHEPSFGHKNQVVCPFCGRVGCHGECLQHNSSVCPFGNFMIHKNGQHEFSLGHKNQVVCPYCGQVGCHGECLTLNNPVVYPYCGRIGCQGECLTHSNQVVCPYCGRIGCHGECLQHCSHSCPFYNFMTQASNHHAHSHQRNKAVDHYNGQPGYHGESHPQFSNFYPFSSVPGYHGECLQHKSQTFPLNNFMTQKNCNDESHLKHSCSVVCPYCGKVGCHGECLKQLSHHQHQKTTNAVSDLLNAELKEGSGCLIPIGYVSIVELTEHEPQAPEVVECQPLSISGNQSTEASEMADTMSSLFMKLLFGHKDTDSSSLKIHFI